LIKIILLHVGVNEMSSFPFSIQPALSFDDVNLLDGYSSIKSRSEVDLSVRLSDLHELKLPILAASMDTINSVELAMELFKVGAGHVYHRYISVEERVQRCSESASKYSAIILEGGNTPYGVNGVAVGLNETAKDVETLIVDGLVELVSIDVAACYHNSIFQKIEEIGEVCSNYGVPLMVGNFCNPSFIKDLFASPAGEYVTLVKVGIGGGSCCSTRVKTGIGMPTFHSVLLANQMIETIGAPYLLVADGGIRSSGDIVKAVGAGAHLVMLGGMLAGHNECPGTVDSEGKKEFRGMASAAAKTGFFSELKNIEGVATALPSRGPVSHTLKDIKEGIQSGVATAGFTSLQSFRGNGEFVVVTPSGAVEARPHILNGR
jgi:IMP dehydrogenase